MTPQARYRFFGVPNLSACFFAAAALLSAVTAARADEMEQAVAVQCHGTAAMVRFGWSDDSHPVTYNPLPPAFARDWAGVPLHGDGRCALADGTGVVARVGQKEAFAYGMGGADPPEFYSVWLDGKKIVSRETDKDGYGGMTVFLAAVRYDAKGITRCRYATDENANFFGEPGMGFSQDRADAAGAKLAVTCATRPVNLARLARDPHETPAWRARIGLIDVAGRDVALCRRFVRAVRPFTGYAPSDEQTPVSTTRRKVTLNGLPVVLPAGRDIGGRFDSGARLRAMTLDFFNIGKPVTVVEQSGDTHYFDGDRFLVSDRVVDDAALKPLDGDVEHAPPGWRAVDGTMTRYQKAGGNSGRYTHFIPFRLAGTTYLLATPANMDDHKPDALLLKPSPSGLKQVCGFTIIGENY
jgi:hypothetical protein